MIRDDDDLLIGNAVSSWGLFKGGDFKLTRGARDREAQAKVSVHSDRMSLFLQSPEREHEFDQGGASAQCVDFSGFNDDIDALTSKAPHDDPILPAVPSKRAPFAALNLADAKRIAKQALSGLASLSAGAQEIEATLKPGIPNMPNQQEKLEALASDAKFREATAADGNECDAIESKIEGKSSIPTESKVEAHKFAASQGCAPEGAPADEESIFSEGAPFQEDDEVSVPPEGAPFPEDDAAASVLEVQAEVSPLSEEDEDLVSSAKAVMNNTTALPSFTIKKIAAETSNYIPELRRHITISNDADLQVQLKVSYVAFYLIELIKITSVPELSFLVRRALFPGCRVDGDVAPRCECVPHAALGQLVVTIHN